MKKLRRCNEWMFQTVKCSAYLKKVRDGKSIIHIDKEYSQSGKEEWCYAWEEDGKTKEKEIPDGECGGSDFVKTYYELVEKEFVGVVVGFETITVKAELFLDWCDNGYSEYYFVNKNPRERVKCARVYYGCNRSRAVPTEDMALLKEGGE